MATIERAFGVTNIRSHIPLVLDLDDFNYDAWRELFQTHCLTFDVLGHIDGSSTPAENNDLAWKKRDGLVKLWIYGTLAPPLFRTSFKKGGTALEVWLKIEDQFRNNKEARAIQLDNDLRTKEIGDLSVKDYCQDLKSIADLLENVDAPVSERTLVTYVLNGLNDKFDYITNVIKHQKPFPTFAEAKNMLEMEESKLKKTKASGTHSDHASSSSALVVTTAEHKQVQSSQPQSRNYNNRGNRRGNRNRGRNYSNNNSQQCPQYMPPYMTQYWPGQYNNWSMQQPGPWMSYPQSGYAPRGYSPRAPAPASHEAQFVDMANQPTRDFSEAFNTMSLTEPSPNWYMDSGASSHLASSPGPSVTENNSPQ